MRRFYAVFQKEFRQVRRDPLSLGMLILLPALLLVLYGYALSFDVKHIRIAVLDESRTPQSRALLDSLFQNPYFDRASTLAAPDEADGILERGEARAVLIIPRDYARSLLRGEPVDLQALVDACNANTATTTIAYLEALADRASRAEGRAVGLRAGRLVQAAVLPEPRLWFNPELKSARFLVPGLIGLLLMLSAVIATSQSIVRERERETIEQMMVSPIRPEELILGKTLPYVLIGAFTMVMILGLGYVLFDVVVRGSFLLLAVTVLLFLFAALGLGVLISCSTASQRVAFQIAILVSLLPTVFLSGFIFPIKNMPLPIQAITTIVVPRYFVSALRAIILKGATLRDVWPQLGMLLALGMFYNLLAAHKTKRVLQ